MAVPAVVPLRGLTGIDVWGYLQTPGRVIGRGTPLLTPDGVGMDLDTKKIAAMMSDVPLPSYLPRFGSRKVVSGGFLAEAERWPS